MVTKGRKERLAVGVDLGGTKIDVILANARGDIRARQWLKTKAEEGSEAVVRRLIASVRRLLIASKDSKIVGIGIAAAGICLPDGVIATSPNLPGWRDVPLRALVEEGTGCRTFLDNDATLAALGEHTCGAAVGLRDIVFVTVSTGIGGGIIIGGKLYSGASGSAGEFGHMTIDVHGPRCSCGKRGHWEALASGTALAREAVRRVRKGDRTSLRTLSRGDLKAIDARLVARAASKGDGVAEALIAQTAHFVGVGLANLINIFNPEMIVIGGGLANIGEPLLGPARRVAVEMAFEAPARVARIVPAMLGGDAGALGATALVFQKTQADRLSQGKR